MFDTLLILAAETPGSTSTFTIGGIIAILIASITSIVIAYINRKERKQDKKRSDDPDVKKRLDEADELKAANRKTILLEDIKKIVDQGAIEAQATTSGFHLNISAALQPITDRLTLLVEFQKELIQNHKDVQTKLSDILRLDQDMHKWHDKDDPFQPGVKVWYSPREEIKELASVIGELNGTMVSVMNQIVQLESAIKLLNVKNGRNTNR